MIKKLLSILTIFIAPFILNAEDEFTVEAYGSLRMQAESVSVDKVSQENLNTGHEDSHVGFRDAFSRFGVKASLAPESGTKFDATLELPFNAAELRAEDPAFFEGFYKENNAPRLYNISATNEKFGSVKLGKQWLAFYNNIAYPVDYFRSSYSGYATHATFRREALTYTTPEFSDVTASISGVDLTDGGDTKYLDTMQYALSYSTEPLSLAIGYQDTHDDRANIIGVSGAYTVGPLRFAAKVERMQSGDGVIKNKDPMVFNLYGSYTANKLTYKAMYANGDGEAGENDEGDAFFIGGSYHLGIDYQHTKNLIFFTEYFFEENGYAIYTRKAEDFTPLSGFQNESDGSAILVGARYDF